MHGNGLTDLPFPSFQPSFPSVLSRCLRPLLAAFEQRYTETFCKRKLGDKFYIGFVAELVGVLVLRKSMFPSSVRINVNLIYIECTSLLLSLELQDLKCKCLGVQR